jgi:hypothetical protein
LIKVCRITAKEDEALSVEAASGDRNELASELVSPAKGVEDDSGNVGVP